MIEKEGDLDFEGLVLSWSGAGPVIVARKIAQEYSCWFSTTESQAYGMLQAFNVNRWSSLYSLLNAIISTELCDVYDRYEIYFFNNVLDNIHLIYGNRKKYSGCNDRAVQCLDICRLCWRSAPKYEKCDKDPLCHIHDAYSRSGKYRKDYRFLKQHNDELLDIFIKSRYCLRDVFDMREGLSPVELMRRGMKIMDDVHYRSSIDIIDYSVEEVFNCLPAVRQFLLEKGIDLTNRIDVIHALEDPPARTHANSNVWKLRDDLYDACRVDFSLFRVQLAWAEAWLQLYNKYPHGGRRAGAGRPGKNKS